MGLFDWLGPTAFGTRRGWDALPAVTETKMSALTDPSVPGPLVVDGVPSFWTPTSAISLVTPQAADGNSAVFACLQAIATAIAEPELRVYRLAPGERVEIERTPLGDLLARPNAAMSLDTLLAYVAVCLHVDGNAYWRKLRAGERTRGNVVELWPIAPSRVEPITSSGSGDFVSFYRYTFAAGRVTDIPAENVVHFRYGIDDDDHRVGIAPLKRLIREISSDEQATRYADRLLANLAINGLSLSFDKEAPSIDQATADELKARIQSAYGGDNVGRTAVLSPGAQLTAIGFSPEQMNLRVLHQVPEERIAAVLGVPASLVGLGAGLDHSIYNNVKQADERFTERKLIPLWRQLAATITTQLARDFTSDRSVVVDFDTSNVRALAEDENATAARLKILVEAGILTKDEARAEIGYEPLPEQDVPAAPEPVPVVLPTPLPAAASRRVVRALPAAQTKAAEDLPDRYAELRESSLPTWEEELAAFFEAQQRRVNARLRAGADQAAELVTDGESVLLGSTLEPLQQAQLGAISRIVAAELGIAFDLPNEAVEDALRLAGVNIQGITSTTRDAVRAALVAGQQMGEGVESIARRMQNLPAFGRERARVVARTELGTTTNIAALTAYRESGVVVGVRISDGDADAPCAAMNGRTFSLDRAPSPLEHPNCTRALLPLTDVSDLEASA